MAKVLYGINALIALVAVALSFTLNISGHYVGNADPSKPTIIGNLPEGIDTPLERFFDWITYFTIWSNITVAVVMVVLFLKPDLFQRTDRVGFLWRTLRLDSLIMIIVTGIVFNLLLASQKSGIDAVSNAMVHIICPIATFLVWLVAGPRGLIAIKTIPASLILPIIWLVFALIRGQIIGAYPYPFLDVATKGMASVLQFVVAIVVFAIILGLILFAIDALIRKIMGRSTAKPA